MSTPPVPPAPSSSSPSSSSSSHPVLTRQQKADAIRNVKELLSQVKTDWEYVPPPPAPAAAAAPTPSRAASTASRSGVLGAWRATTGSASHEEQPENARDSWDEMWDSTESSSDDDDDDDDSDAGVRRPVSYRRADTPPPAKKRRRHRRREGVWRERVEDSDFEVPEGEGWRWEEAGEVARRRAARRWQREQMRENPGLRTWLRRRDQWTGADREGYVPVGESRFRENPLQQLVTPNAYREIYQRCVVNGAALPVPVNLKNMVEALVEGWKADDMWPPKNTTEVPVVVGPRGEVRPKVPMGEEAGKSMSGRVRKYLGIR